MWMLVAFGGAPAWTLPPALAMVLAGALALRPPVAPAGARALDLALLCCLGWMLLQAIPLPMTWRDTLSPHAADIDRLLRFGGGSPSARALSIDRAATLRALLVAAMSATMFWTSREICARGGVRLLLRTVAWSGLAISVVAVVTRASAPDLLYGMWDPGVAARPYGPFVNRNHMGTWLVMALPPVVGYMFARIEDRHAGANPAAAIDATMVWLMAAATAMLAAIIISLSRSSAVGTLSAAIFVAATAGKRRRGIRWAVVAAAVVAIGIVVSLPNTMDLAQRFENSRTTATWARAQIWRETLPIVRDFALTGTGAGTFRTAMLVYQQSDRAQFFNQAHNHYLQLAAEGGLLMLIPLAVAALAFATAVARRLRQDRSAMFWIRTGAVGGVVGVLVQSIWETGLRLPANALLFAVVCALAVHGRRD